MQTDQSDYVIETQCLCRSFNENEILKNVDLRVPRASIYGLLGANGCGKTTLAKILVGLIKPTSGTVRVLGRSPFEFTPEDRQKVGYVSEKQILLPNYRIASLVKFCAQFYPFWDHNMVRRLLTRFQIDSKRKVSVLSYGAQRQIAFVLALAQRPKLLILDEPTSGLDATVRREFLDEILTIIREEGASVLIAADNPFDIERIADQIGILVNGRLRINESIDNLKETVKQIRFYSPDRSSLQVKMPNTFRTRHSGNEILITARIKSEESVAQIAEEAGIEYEIIDLPLEDIFMEVL